jgi:hypothetical protein
VGSFAIEQLKRSNHYFVAFITSRFVELSNQINSNKVTSTTHNRFKCNKAAMTQTVTSKAARNQLLRPMGIGVQLNQPITQHVTGHQDNIIYQLK